MVDIPSKHPVKMVIFTIVMISKFEVPTIYKA